MEKEKLSATLSGLVGENSLSQRTWNDYLDNSVMPFIPSDEEKMDDFLGKHATALKSINGQLNNEVATRVNDFKKNYKPEPTPVNNLENPHKKDEKLEDLENRLQRFEQAEAEKQATKVRTEKLSEVRKQMIEQGASHETVLGLILPQLEIKDGATIEDLSKAGKALYDKAYRDLYGDSYVPVMGGGGTSGNAKSDKETYMKHLKETGRIK